MGKSAKSGKWNKWHWALLLFALMPCCWMFYKAFLGIPVVLHLPDVYEVGKGVAIFDRNDKHVSTVYADRDSVPVPIAKVSMMMRRAVLAAEDHHFYEHHGIDPIGVSRAVFRNVSAGHLVQGGSTITQQLARNLYLDIQDRSPQRKITEALLSLDIELNNPKDKILEAYMNDIYFGRSVYGVERAAGAYFNKHASALTLPEAAFLAGVIRQPTALSNPKNLSMALDRQHQVLDAMVEGGDITPEQAEHARKVKLVFRRGAPPAQPFPYYVNYVVQLLKKDYTDKQIWGTGLRVYTDLDVEAQQAAEKYLSTGINTAPVGINQGALVSMSVKDGGVIAMVGGVGEYRSHQWNRAIYPHTAGSAFKPFVYLAGIANGVLKQDTMLQDSPLTIDSGFGHTYSPKNFDGKFLGVISVRQALSLSRNVCAIRVAQAVGIDKVINIARACGITSPLDNNITVALGSSAVSPLEMATAYATLARSGVYMPAQLIRRIDNSEGLQLVSYSPEQHQVLPAEPVMELVDVLQDVVQHGTGTQAKLANIAVAGKTGTADKARDIWFCGFTPDTVTTVWGGNDAYREVRGNVTGGTVMGKIWHDYMTAFYKLHPVTVTAFKPPAKPLARTNSTINANVLKDIQQYEEGTKTDPEQLTNANQPGADQGTDEEQLTDSGNPGDQKEPPLAPPIERNNGASNGEKNNATDSTQIDQRSEQRQERPSDANSSAPTQGTSGATDFSRRFPDAGIDSRPAPDARPTQDSRPGGQESSHTPGRVEEPPAVPQAPAPSQAPSPGGQSSSDNF